MLILFLGILWLAGGASRADALGQSIVRSAAALALACAALSSPRASMAGLRPVTCLLLAAFALPLCQLVPLPPSWWQVLPGRALLVQAAEVSGQPQPWRPIAIVPGAAWNAAASLIVPAATLVLVATSGVAGRRWLPPVILSLIGGSAVLGLMQFAGASFNNPFINDTIGQVSGPFANRNHLALFLAMGCCLAPAWAFLGRKRPGWRAPLTLGLVLLFTLMILATGSRAGLLLGVIAIGLGILLTRVGIRHDLRRRPRWVFPALIGSVVAVVGIVVLIAAAAGRAVAIDRLLTVDPGQDMRSRGLPTVLAMVVEYFPFGSGLGGFDPLFRLHEPFSLLKLTYFNHAHNDWLEIVLDTGALGLVLLALGVAWWGWASVAAWRAEPGVNRDLALLGSAMLLFVMVASASDYPARTPIMMAMIVISASWLADRDRDRTGRPATSALPRDDRDL